MLLTHHPEPLLEFARGSHQCPRAGIAAYDVYDSRLAVRRHNIHVGSVGTADDLESFATWVQRVRNPIPGKLNARQPTLFAPFCGFNSDRGFRATLGNEDTIQRRLAKSEVRRLVGIAAHDERVHEAVEAYFDHAQFLTQNRTVDVIVCVLPPDLYEALRTKKTPERVERSVEPTEPDDIVESDFRRALKARCLQLGAPIQLVRAEVVSPNPKGLQDDATIAWNLCTALYYKANRTVPWRLPVDSDRPSVCYAGIGFYRSRDREILNTSLAQIFNELGNGVILRGTPVDVHKEDRRPFVTAAQAETLLSRALDEYQRALEHSPGRLVIHRTSRFRDEELEGFRSAAASHGVSNVDFLTIGDTDVRLFRKGLYPPARGTRLQLNENDHLLYTRGSVPYYGTYPGMYIPQPLRVTVRDAEASGSRLCEEILALTKMNWNNTQFDGKYPITLQCAGRVGDILKYLPPEFEPPISYGFYM